MSIRDLKLEFFHKEGSFLQIVNKRGLEFGWTYLKE